MDEIIILGSGFAHPQTEAEYTHLFLKTDDKKVLIDTGSNPIVSMYKAGINPHLLTDLIITHFHPDHVSGLPLLIMGLWLQQHHDPLVIHGLTSTINKIRANLDLYDWRDWPKLFPVEFHNLNETYSSVIQSESLSVFSEPVKHLIPTIGLRCEIPHSQKIMAYTSDTEPCDAILEIADNANYLFHEAAGKAKGHSSAAQAGENATKSGVKSLYLIHYPLDHTTTLIQEAGNTFNGPVFLAKDLMHLDFK